jgi:hypothetical protein
MDASRVVAIAHNVFRETIRDRILYLVMVFAVAMLGAAVLIPQVANQAHNKIIAGGSSRVDLQACKLGTGRRFTTS